MAQSPVFPIRFFFLLLFTIAIPLVGNTAPNQQLPLKSLGHTSVSWSPSQGLKLLSDGVPVIRESTLYLVKKDWSGVFIDQRDADWRITDWKKDSSDVWIATASTENNNGALAYQFTLRKAEMGESFQVDLRYRLKPAAGEGAIEYAAGYLSGNVLRGARLTSPQSAMPGETTISLVPPPQGGSQTENRLLTSFQSVQMNTRLGNIDISYSGNAPLPVLFDARSDAQEWASKFPVFWMGIGSPAPLLKAADGEQRATFIFTLQRTGNLPKTALTPRFTSLSQPIVNDAYIPLPSEPLIIPRPKIMEILRGQKPFRFSKKLSVFPADTTPGTRRAIRILQQAIQERFGFMPPVKTGKLPPGNVIILGVRRGKPDSPDLSVPRKAEGYAISVTPDNIRMLGNDEAGILWAVQSLTQVMTADSTGSFIPALAIQDWPSLPLRGVHLFHGVNALPFHEKLIDRIFSRFKLNALFIEAEHLKWDTVGAAAPKWGGTKGDIKKEISYARERGVTVYPLVQGFGHMETLFGATGNQAFAEDPENPWAVNFSNPKAVAYLTKLLTEADDLFKAPAFHVGMDEIDLRGRFPYRSLPKTKPELFALAAGHWRDVFARRGKPVYLWADMLMAAPEVRPAWGTQKIPAEAKRTRELTPKDVTLVDWQYGVQEEFPSLRFLQKAGFKNVLAASWFQPENIRNLSKSASEAGAKGIIQTTWCGYESKEEVLNGPERRQFTAMVLAAEYFWNGGTGESPDKLPYDAGHVFTKAYRGFHVTDAKSAKGSILQFERVAGMDPAHAPEYDAEDLPAALPRSIRLADGVLYQFTKEPVLLAGKLNPPGEYPLSLNVPLSNLKTSDIRLLLTATCRAELGTEIGSLTLEFVDGTKRKVPLQYGGNIAAWDDSGSATDAPILWRNQTKNGQSFFLRGLSPLAESSKPIVSLQISSSNTESGIYIYAITSLQR